MGSESRLVASTSNRGLRPAGTPGQRDHGLLTRILRERLSETHARLFAEPVPSPDGRATDWYVEGDGAVSRLDELPAETRATLRAKVEELQADIMRLAAELEASGAPERQIQAEMLRVALEVPDPAENYVRQIGDAPILVGWGLVRDVPDPPAGVLTAWVRAKARPASPLAAASAAAAPPKPAPVAGGGRDALPLATAPADAWRAPLLLPLWLLFGLLVLWVSWLMLTACGLDLPLGLRLPWADRCVAVAASAPDLRREVESQRVLETEIAALEREVARERARCRSGGGATEQWAEPPDGQTPASERAGLEERLDRENARSGKVEVSLIWDSRADLDLAVICPSGEQIFFDRRAACGGELQIDMNAGEPSSDEPVENIVWLEGAATPGTYQVQVTAYRPDPDTRREIPFEVHVKRGSEEEVHRGLIPAQPRRPVTVVTFNLP